MVGEFEANNSKGERTIYLPGPDGLIWNQVRAGPGLPIWEQKEVKKPEEAWFCHKMPAKVALKQPTMGADSLKRNSSMTLDPLN